MTRARILTNPDYYWRNVYLPEGDPQYLVEVLMVADYLLRISESEEIVIFQYVGTYGDKPMALPVKEFDQRYSFTLKKEYKLSKSRV